MRFVDLVNFDKKILVIVTIMKVFALWRNLKKQREKIYFLATLKQYFFLEKRRKHSNL
jgi:hypothetical protein